LAGASPDGDLLVFFWSPQMKTEADWQVVNVSEKTGQQIAGPLTSWQVPDGPFLVEHLAGPSPTGDLLVFFWSPQTDWQVVNVSAITKLQIAGPVTSWVTDGVEQLAAAGLNNELYVFWRMAFGRRPNPGWGYCSLTQSPPNACTKELH
jgi:hypothetical protein